MAAAEAVIVPSEWYEGLPLVILRGLAVGTPIIVSDLENICEDVIADDAGYSFQVGNARSLAETLTHVASHRDELTAKRGNARASYEARYTPEADLGRLVAIYSDVVATASAAPAAPHG
jgi:glycosyltransferase involved in cell wall biosynthesis